MYEFQTLKGYRTSCATSQGSTLPSFPSQFYLGGGIIALKPNVEVTIGNWGENTLLVEKAQEGERFIMPLNKLNILK